MERAKIVVDNIEVGVLSTALELINSLAAEKNPEPCGHSDKETTDEIPYPDNTLLFIAG